MLVLPATLTRPQAKAAEATALTGRLAGRANRDTLNCIDAAQGLAQRGFNPCRHRR
jgi:hypothetical protein